MEQISKRIICDSNRPDDKDIIKVFVASEEEIADVIDFEKILRKILAKYPHEEDVISNLNIAKKEYAKSYSTMSFGRRNYYEKYIEKYYSILNTIRSIKNIINNQRKMNYPELLYYIVKYSKNPQIIKTYIKSAKHLDYDDTFLNMFGPDGNVLKEQIINLDRVLRKLAIKYEDDNQTLFTKLTRLFYTKEEFEMALQQKDEEMLLKLSSKTFTPVSNGQTTTETTTKSFSRFINGSGTLNQFAINYPLQEVLEDISHYVSEDQLKDYEEQYYLLYTMREINSIMSLKANKEQQQTLLRIKSDIRLLEMAKKIVLSEEYQNAKSVSQKRELIIEEFFENNDEFERSEEGSKTLFIFPDSRFVEIQLGTINAKSNKPLEVVKKGINTRFRSLINNSLIELRKNYGAVVHHVLETSNISFKVANKFELYRYGHKVYKLCYVSLPISEENKEALIEKYSLSDDFQIMAVVGFGNVQIEEEIAFYDRVKKETKKYNDIIKRLSELLIKPFTEESFNVICRLIEQSSSQLKEQLDIDYLTIKGSKRVR